MPTHARVLLTGATGYIGSRLLPLLEEGGHAVRCLARRPHDVAPSSPRTEVVRGDCLDEVSLDRALAGIDTAYYFVHSMAAGAGFAELDRQAATNFGRAAARARVRRIVYLGGLGDRDAHLSTHLHSRAQTGAALREGGVPVVEFRASIVIGAGSLAFEMIRALVERLPVMVCPRWVDTSTQPIAVDDVLAYLLRALDTPAECDGVYEIGGPEVVSYGDMMRMYADLRGLRRLLIPVPVLTPRLSGLWLRLVTPAQATVGRALVEGLRNETVVRSLDARRLFDVSPMPLGDAMVRAIEASSEAHWKVDTREVVVDVPPDRAFDPIRRIGGTTGWYFGQPLWRIRGWIDRRFGGQGMTPGRRHPIDCAAGDIVDGWAVEEYVPDRRLRLAAGLKLPGRGWLEFEVRPIDGGSRSLIRQTARFDPRGLLGRAYWYAVLPLHAMVFSGLLRRIAAVAEKDLRGRVVSVFTYHSIVHAPAHEVFAWHEQPAALAALLPRRFMRIERQTGGVRNGGRVTLSLGLGPFRMQWEARHYGYLAGVQFWDEQVRGPFAIWRHRHRCVPFGPGATLYEDRVEYAVTPARFLDAVASRLLRPVLTGVFRRRHERVRAQLEYRSVAPSPARLGAATLVLAAVLAGAGQLQAQDTAGVGTLRGVVSAGGRPAADVAVCVPATAQCVVSDAGGQFSLSLRPGEYALEVAAPGRPPIVSEGVRVRAGVDNLIEVDIPESVDVQQTVTVAAPSVAVPDEMKTSTRLIARDDIAASAAALQDVSRYVQSLPGVAVGTNDFRNDVIVRGGSPLENLYIVDNIEIPNINAFANFASAGGSVGLLDVQLIDNVTFLTGGYPAPFGNRTSGVLQVTQREGRRDRLDGRATVGFAGAGAVVEGPIGAARGSWIVSARRSFLDVFTDDTGIGGVPVVYTLNAKAVYDVTSRDRLWAVNVTGVDSIRLGLTENSDLSEELSNLDIRYRGWRSASGVNWQRVYRRGVGLFGVTYARAGVDQRVLDLLRNGVPPAAAPIEEQLANGEVVFRERSSEADTTLKYDLSVSLPFIDTLQAGGSVKVSQVDYTVASPFGTDSPYFPANSNPFAVTERLTAVQSGGYAQATRPVVGRLSATAGARVDRYSFVGATKISPRFGLDYALTPRATLRGSYGHYYQQPFFLFLVAHPGNRSLQPFRADHYVGGVTVDLDRSTRVSVEGYRKRYSDYPVSSDIPSLSLANVGDTFAVRDILFPMVGTGRGVVTGVELFVERRASDRSRLSGEANLSVSRARHAGLDGVLRPGSFDYPVIGNAAGTVRLSDAWRMSANVAYLAGRPLTPVDQAASTMERRAVYDLSRVNAERAPDYFRLDLRIDRVFNRDGRRGSIFAGVQNVTNRKNFAGYSWDRRGNAFKRLEQIGVFPILGVEWPL